MAQAAAIMAAVAAGAAGLLWIELQKQRRERQQEQAAASEMQAHARSKRPLQPQQPERQSQQQSPLQRQLAAACPAAADIPHDELAALHAFLKRVYRWRGWQAGAYHILQAWHEVEAAAALEAHGGWQQQFAMATLRDANCNSLLRLIDRHFCGGRLLRLLACKDASTSSSSSSSNQPSPSYGAADGAVQQLPGASAVPATGCSSSHHGPLQQQQQQQQGAPAGTRLHCQVVQNLGPHGTWLAYFDPADNAVRINHWRWNKDVSTARPVNCEGVVCSSRLQMLLHTLAHELVHAVVFHVFPEMDRGSAAYLARQRHGPIFQLLNKQLFGHSSDALEEAAVGGRHL